MKSMEEMIQAAQQAAETIQKQMNETQAKLDQLEAGAVAPLMRALALDPGLLYEVEGLSGGGLVKIRCTAKGRVIGVSIDDSLLQPSEKGMLEDLVAAAYNDARVKSDSVANEEMAKAQQGMGLPPGFKMPF